MTIATTLNGAINAIVTTIVVRDVLGFPSSGTYKVTIGTERLTVTAGQGTTSWTVTRGVDSTTAAIHADGAPVYLYQEAYATIDDLLLTMGQVVDDTQFLANATRRLREASLDLDREIGYSALQTSGTRILNGDGSDVLHVHGGIVALDTVEIRLYTGSAWTVLDVQDTGWFLEGALGDPNAWDGIYYHLRLSPDGTYTEFPSVYQGIRLTGDFGGVAELRRAATVAWARQRISLDPSVPGGLMSGPEDLGAAVAFDKWPRVVYDLIVSERHRFWEHV